MVKKYAYPSLTRTDTQAGRKYVTSTGEKLPSVTTILDKVKDKSFLIEWKNKIGEQEAQRITTEAATIGTSLHKNLENYLEGKEFTGTILAKKMAQKVIDNAFPKISEVWGSEVSLFSEGLYAGTTDLVGVWNGVPAIIDYKNSRKEKKLEYIEDYRAQLAAYALAHNEMFTEGEIKAGVVIVVTRDVKYQEFVFEGADFEKNITIWLDKLTQYYKISQD